MSPNTLQGTPVSPVGTAGLVKNRGGHGVRKRPSSGTSLPSVCAGWFLRQSPCESLQSALLPLGSLGNFIVLPYASLVEFIPRPFYREKSLELPSVLEVGSPRALSAARSRRLLGSPWVGVGGTLAGTDWACLWSLACLCCDVRDFLFCPWDQGQTCCPLPLGSPWDSHFFFF